jgi:hypothetical protein
VYGLTVLVELRLNGFLILDERNGDFTSTTGGPLTIEFLNYNQIRCCKMDAALKIVTHLPLRELWRHDGLKTSARIRSLTKDDIRSLLRCGPIQFVVVDVGSSPHWIQPSECFQFWTSEAQPHLAREAGVILEWFPGGYCYSASEWDGGDPAAPIVVLEKQH